MTMEFSFTVFQYSCADLTAVLVGLGHQYRVCSKRFILFLDQLCKCVLLCATDTHAHTHTHAHARTQTYTHTNTHIHTHARARARVHTHTYK